MAGCLAGGFAKGFGYLDDGLLAGLVHDLGKYSDAFQRRIRNPDHCGPVDHSTAGALLLMRHACPLAAMAVAGHHAGLPDLGSYGELEGPTFMSRMNRARRAGDCNPLALAQAGEAQLDIPQSAFLHGTRSAKPMTASKRSERWSLYTDMMLTRMLFSALVDADRLDAEFFTSNRIDRAEHHILESLKKHLGPQNLTSGRVPAFDALREASLTVSVERDAEDRSRIDRLAAIMEEAADGYLAAPDKRPIDIRRCELLERCLACGKDPSYGTGLYTLTAPTGSGKTISSIAFALEHARTNNLRRVIYVIPYTSIIDQTVGQFEAIFGTDAVLPHYSEAPYQLKNESDMDETDLRRALAAENWNAPIVVTTAVQFFESLYSNATSRCRKLHNIADSVIVFDEAQTLPVPYLRPCVRAIAELVERYGSTAVLCTATQPELQPLFDESFDGDHVRVPEISKIRNDSTKPTRTTTNRERTMTDRKPIENRYDFTILFEVKDGNPNGDPDSGNMPRVDIETGNGLTTDVCVKRKIRDYVQTVMGEQAPWRIYIQNRQTLNRLDSEALKAEHIDTSLESKDFAKEIKALKKTDPELDQRLRDYMCDQFFDIRTFGAVMTTFVKGSLSCGQVRGPVQLGFARSIDPISVQEISITRIAVTTEADAAEKNNTMGNKFIIPYGLYRMNGYISAKLSQNVTGFCDEDLDVLWQAILNMFEFDRSAARGNMAVRKLYVFKHSSALGDAPSWKLFDSINVHKRAEVDAPRDFADYEVRVNREAIPESVSLTEMVDHAL